MAKGVNTPITIQTLQGVWFHEQLKIMLVCEGYTVTFLECGTKLDVTQKDLCILSGDYIPRQHQMSRSPGQIMFEHVDDKSDCYSGSLSILCKSGEVGLLSSKYFYSVVF